MSKKCRFPELIDNSSLNKHGKPMRAFLNSLVISLAISAPMTVSAALFDDTKELKGKVIISAGEFEKIECPIGGDYDCSTWPDGLLRTPEYGSCIVINGFACSFRCKGLLVTDNSRALHFFEFDSGIGAPNLKKHAATPVRCPDVY